MLVKIQIPPAIELPKVDTSPVLVTLPPERKHYVYLWRSPLTWPPLPEPEIEGN